MGTGRRKQQQQAHGNGNQLSKQFPLSYGMQARSTLAVGWRVVISRGHRNQGVAIIGTAAVLLLAKERGLVKV